MSIYEEALVDAKKLKEVAELDAKNAIISKIAPTIKEMISKELMGNVILEEEEPLATVDSGMATGDLSKSEPASTLVPTTADMSAAPIKPAGVDTLNMPMPSSDGTLIVSFDDMFAMASEDEAQADVGGASMALDTPVPPVDTAETLPTDPATAVPAMDAPVPQEQEELPGTGVEETYELFAEELDKTSKKINKIFSSKDKKQLLIVRESLQGKLFNLLESLEKMGLNESFDPMLGKIFKNRLEILHIKLKEANLDNTYYQEKKDTEMAKPSIKEIGTKLINESDTVEGGPNTSPADSFKDKKEMRVDNPTEKSADKAGKHAMAKTEPTVTLKTEAAKLEEEMLNFFSESEGDSLAGEEGKEDLAGAASTIPDEKVGKTSVDHVAIPESKKLKAESLKKEIALLEKQLQECSSEMSMEDLSGVQTPGEEGKTVVNFNFDLAGLIPELEGASDDDEIEITDDEDMDDMGDKPASGASLLTDKEPSAETDMGSDDEEDEEEEPASKLGGGFDSKEMTALSEASRRAAKKVIAENKNLKEELKNQQVFNAKLVHLQPFLNNKNLDKRSKEKIVEFLDRGTTVEEVKSIYESIKQKLDKSSKAKVKGGASSSQATKSGSLNESVSQETTVESIFENAVLVEHERNRFAELAGIKKNKS